MSRSQFSGVRGLLLGLAAGAGAVALARRARALEPSGRIALVTGGSRGLGFLVARELLERGCAVVICARDALELERARARLSRHGPVLAFTCDVADASRVRAMVEDVERRLGPIDIVVNNAGIIKVGPEGAMTPADYREAMDVMFWGAVNTTLAVLPSMKARRSGRIANITSIGGTVAVPHLIPYGAAKFAAVGFSQGMRAELRRHGILVTTVVPGLMRTGSPVNARFRGNAPAEYGWFSAASATPVTAMDAERAARRVVRALAHGEAQVVLSWQAKLLRLAHALAPGLVADVLGVVNRLLPRDAGHREFRGMDVDPGAAANPLLRPLHETALRNNEFAGSYPSGEAEPVTM